MYCLCLILYKYEIKISDKGRVLVYFEDILYRLLQYSLCQQNIGIITVDYMSCKKELRGIKQQGGKPWAQK